MHPLYIITMQSLNIVNLIEKNPVTKLTNIYNNKLLKKIQENFTNSEQQLFISSFYCYLNYNNTADFAIDLDNIWKWLGFNQKVKAVALLEKHFIKESDYKILLSQPGKQTKLCKNDNENIMDYNKIIKKGRGGHNKETFLLNIKTFKSLCLKAGTKKAGEIHDYYIKMEDILYATLEEETTELKLKLLEKEKIIGNSKKEKLQAVEKALITQFPVNIECIYFGTIDNTNDKKEKLLKFGHTNDLSTRVQNHHKIYENFILKEAFKVQNKVEIENLIKTYPKIKKHIRTIEIDGKNKTEILAYDDTNFTIPRLSKYIKDIIHSKTYSIDNFNKMLVQVEELENENRDLKETIENLNKNAIETTLKIKEQEELILKQEHSITSFLEQDKISTKSLLPEDELTKRFNEFVYNCCIVRNDVEVDSCDIIAQFRIWNGIKPKREVSEKFNTYLKTRFLATRLQNQNKEQCVHGFVGIMLKPITYIKKHLDNFTENFLFEMCSFKPNNRIAMSKLHKELVNYKKKMSIPISNNELDELKEYLNSCNYVQKGTLYIQDEKTTHDGYYGLALKSDNTNIRKNTSVSGKKIQKIDNITGLVINVWESIIKAAIAENMSASKMSRSIKNKLKLNDCYYIKAEIC